MKFDDGVQPDRRDFLLLMPLLLASFPLVAGTRPRGFTKEAALNVVDINKWNAGLEGLDPKVVGALIQERINRVSNKTFLKGLLRRKPAQFYFHTQEFGMTIVNESMKLSRRKEYGGATVPVTAIVAHGIAEGLMGTKLRPNGTPSKPAATLNPWNVGNGQGSRTPCSSYKEGLRIYFNNLHKWVKGKHTFTDALERRFKSIDGRYSYDVGNGSYTSLVTDCLYYTLKFCNECKGSRQSLWTNSTAKLRDVYKLATAPNRGRQASGFGIELWDTDPVWNEAAPSEERLLDLIPDRE